MTILSGTYSADVKTPVDGSRVVRFILSTAALDRHGTRFSPEGLRGQAFLKNPAFVWNHKDADADADPDDVIGRALALEVAGDRITIPVEFEGPQNPKAERCFQKVKDGFLRAVSLRAMPISSHKEGDITVYDQWELLSASLCIVGSNPEALALRALLSGPKTSHKRTVPMNPLEKLGLAEGASADEQKAALLKYLCSTDDPAETRMQVAEAVSKQQPGEGGDAGGEGRAAGDDESGGGEGDTGAETEANRAAVAQLSTEVRSLRDKLAALEQKQAGPTAKDKPAEWVDAQIKAGKWSAGGRAQLLELCKRSAPAAEKAVAAIPEGTFSVDPKRTRTFPGGNPAAAGAESRSAPNFGVSDAAANKTAKSLLSAVSADIARGVSGSAPAKQ